ncbi:MAG TPA: CoA-binding protein [Phycisphaerales bacterium]|nr:CoA-binding protein [Phycisphaerales bacterium]
MRAIVIGASSDRTKFGNRAVRAYLKAGWEVVGVNPNAAGTEVEGVKVYETVADVPKLQGGWDRALFYIPPRYGVNAVRKVHERGDVAEVWLNPGADGPEVIAEAETLGVPFVQACAIMDVGPMPR